MEECKLRTANEWADFWRYAIGTDPIPANTKHKNTNIEWSKYAKTSVSEEEYDNWKSVGSFEDGIAIFCGQIHRGSYEGLYLVGVDIDTKNGIEEFCSYFGRNTSIKELSDKTIIEMHEDNPNRIHAYILSPISFLNKGPDHKIGIEIKSRRNGLMFCSNSPHENGFKYQIIGTLRPCVLNKVEALKMIQHINGICKKYGIDYLDKKSSINPELRKMIKTLELEKNSNLRINQGERHNSLISIANSILFNHLKENYENENDLITFFKDINQTLCSPEPLPEEEIKSIWSSSSDYVKENKDYNFKTTHSNVSDKAGVQSEDKEYVQTKKTKQIVTVFKYTSENQVYESVLLDGKPVFLTLIDNEILIRENIEEETRILKPPNIEEYPGEVHFKFKDKEEISKYVNTIEKKNITIDAILDIVRNNVSKFLVHDKSVIDYIASMILFSYFQDKFPTVPYTMFVSDNGSGKSTIGNIFEVLGYRCMNMTDPTTPNVFRIFGTVESGQCMLVLDEAEKIDKDKDMMSILKTGYEKDKKVQRINPLGKQEHFHTYGLKIMLAERSPNPFYAKGVLDRTFIISNYKGKPRYDIKEIKNHTRGKQEFLVIRNLILIFRLMNIHNKIPNIETGLEGRDKELCKPILQLFLGSKFQGRLEKALEKLLKDKNNRKLYSLEKDVLESIVLLIKDTYSNGIIPISEIWGRVIRQTNGQLNQFKENEVITEMYGNFTKVSILKMIRDRFGPEDKRYELSRCLAFNVENLNRYYQDYLKGEKFSQIHCDLVKDDANDANDANIELVIDIITNHNNEEDDLDPPEINDDIHGTSNIGDMPELNNDIGLCELDNRAQGLKNSVIPVISVSDNYNHKDTIYRLYPHGDLWGCHNCSFRGDKWDLLKHPCKSNRS